MAQAMASMLACVALSSRPGRQPSHPLDHPNTADCLAQTRFSVRAQHQNSADTETSRRAMLGLVAAGIASGSFVQAFSLKQANQDWSTTSHLRWTPAEYLRYDLKTVISAKPKEEETPTRPHWETPPGHQQCELIPSSTFVLPGYSDLLAPIDTSKSCFVLYQLDHAAKIKSTPEAEKYYAETVATLDDVLSKLG
ncbi:UNVERIFIED_CONTAM: Oxygen-evolving enhancer protein 3, chloroplastic [Sesamum radiatum]|uniref:Oxygen-evolving enhancer protein 3, chloroplastic n=1 Tax=Sesamum radiatum TaxID=300843 RepID=A0AAW2KGL8_SESRA